MGVDDDLLLEALGARGADVVHAQRVDHRRADVAGHAAQGRERHDDDRQRDVIEHVDELIPPGRVDRAGRLRAGDREDAPVHAEEEHEDQRDDVDRQAVAQHRDDLHAVIDLAPLVHGAVDAQRDGDAQRQNGGKDVDEDRVAHGRGDDVHHVLLEELGVAEVALQKAVEAAAVHVGPQAHPAHVAHDQRVVQAHLLTQLLIHLLILGGLETHLLRLQLRAGGVGGNQVIQGVHQK